MSESEIQLSRRDFALCISGFLALLGASGADAVLNHGLHDPVAVKAAAARLNLVPKQIGSWTSSPEEIDEREKRMAGIVGSLRRTYRNPENGYVVSMTILCGAAGPMSVHPPTACFEGVGYELSSGPSVVTFEADAAAEGLRSSFNRATFRLPDASTSEVVRVFWGWSSDGIWSAPETPRIAFRGRSYLYKLYVVDRSMQQVDDVRQSETFLELALAEIRKGLRQQ
ncbi:MAG: exosortase-associated EpsI family protein [Planctomycetota bacterium]|nr:exosortase-associated EpsI family protein [Planctomycetota bacterium]